MSRLFEALSSQEAERRRRKVVPWAVAAAEVVPSDVTGLEAVPPDPATEVSTEYCSSQEPHAKVAPHGVIFPDTAPPEPTREASVFTEISLKPVGTAERRSIHAKASPESRLVALTDPDSLGAEKFRALVARLDDMRKQHELKSFQVTSSVVNEGKTLVAGNVAVTLANCSGSKTLLIEGDLHRPSLATRFGLNELRGLSHWWSGPDQDLTSFLHRLNDIPLWFLSAGKPCQRPSDIIRSARFAKAFAQLASQFEWIVVDSAPMLPIVDVNLWSKLVDGTLLVVREGLTPVKALKKGLQALDHPKLIGVVINEASESDQWNYDSQYYGAGKPAAGQRGKVS